MTELGDKPVILFVVTEDWFFASHFLPMARAAVEAGFRPVVATRVQAHAGAIEATGATVMPLDIARSQNSVGALVREARQVAKLIRQIRPAIVHCIALRAIAIGGLACRLTRTGRPVYALTGTGLLGTAGDLRSRLVRYGTVSMLRAGIASRRARFLLENRADAGFLHLSPDDRRVLVIGGAGVDPAAYPEQPALSSPPLRLALVARMIWTKGVDTAVEAVSLARGKGADVTLSLFGAADPANPRAIPLSVLEAWAKRDGIAWLGATRDVVGVWAEHHAAVLPSRGGEGLPRTLLETGSCGRAILTTDVPGCRDLVRNGIEGFVVPPDDPRQLAEAILRLAEAPALVMAMGQAARRRIEAGYTERHVMDAVAGLWRAMLSQS